MSPLKSSVVLLGAGNLATRLGVALYEKKIPVIQVYSRTEESAKKLGERLECEWTTDLGRISPDGTLYIFALKDSALQETLEKLPPLPGLFVHTAGSIPMDLFLPYHDRYGVLYPLQTFSKDREVLFETVPIFWEANNPEDGRVLEELAETLSQRVVPLDSERRRQLHLAAVFACNFTNHLYLQATEIVEKAGLPREYLLPLIRETADKVETLHPRSAQTGPAIRYDRNVIDKQLDLLEGDPGKQELYRLISKLIYSASRESDGAAKRTSLKA